MTAMTFHPATTGLVLVDPYNDVLSEGGKVWPEVGEVAESTGTVGHLRELLGAFRTAGLPAARAEAILPASDVVAALTDGATV